MDRILKKFCAKEVQILLTRIRERPEDFQGNSYNIWQRLVDHGKHYTWIERKLIDEAAAWRPGHDIRPLIDAASPSVARSPRLLLGIGPAEEATVTVEDRGYLLGDGVFTTLRAYEGLVFRADAHLADVRLGLEHRQHRRVLAVQEVGHEHLDLQLGQRQPDRPRADRPGWDG